MGIGIGHGGRIRRRLQLSRAEAAAAAAAAAASLPTLVPPRACAERQQDQCWPLEVRLALFVLEAGADLAGQADHTSSADPQDNPPTTLTPTPAATGATRASRARLRRSVRETCRIRAKLVPLTNGAGPAGNRHETVTIYLRDASDACAGFICAQPLEIGAPFWLSLPSAGAGDAGSRITPADPRLHAAVKVWRCRPFMNDWYEGAIHLSDEAIPATNVGQPLLEVLRIAV